MKNASKLYSEKNPIRVQFRDISGWPDIDAYWIRFLKKYGRPVVQVDRDPDLILYSMFGMYKSRPTKYFFKNKARVVFFTGENSKPDKYADFNLTYEHSSDFSNERWPLWAMGPHDPNSQMKQEKKTEFCSFVYSHKIKFRNQLCKDISEYKKVNCGGGCLNNVGYKVKDKEAFQKSHKFDISCENSQTPGYVTEKIFNAYHSNCIPIYFGSNKIEEDFNPETFINAHKFSSRKDLIDYIKEVDHNDALYQSYFNKPIFSEKWRNIFKDEGQSFYERVCERICPSSLFPFETNIKIK